MTCGLRSGCCRIEAAGLSAAVGPFAERFADGRLELVGRSTDFAAAEPDAVADTGVAPVVAAAGSAEQAVALGAGLEPGIVVTD